MKQIILIFSLLISSLIAYGGPAEEAGRLLRQAREAMQKYDFSTAATRYSAYQAALKKAGMPVDSLAREENSAISRLKNALESVEDLIIFDSLNIQILVLEVDDTLAEEDLNARIFSNRWNAIIDNLHLPAEAGRFVRATEIPFITNAEEVDGPVYINADGTTAIWSAPGPRGENVLYEGTRMADGTWQTESVNNIPAPAYSPFLLDDGLTLYYTSDNYQTLGGRDVMMSTRNSITEDWRQPQNLGMPYNSPFDELLFAIDATDSIGWLVTTRNFLDGDSATIYYFIPSDTRRNLDDLENVTQRARISSIADTWPEGFSPTYKITLKNSIKPATPKVETTEFVLHLPDGTTFTCYDQLKNDKARRAMKEYLEAADKVTKTENELNGMYDEYSRNGRTSELADVINKTEVNLDYLRADATRKLNRVYKYLGFK